MVAQGEAEIQHLGSVLVGEALSNSYGLEFGPLRCLAAPRSVGLRSWQPAVG